MIDKKLTRQEKLYIYRDILYDLLLHKQKRDENMVENVYDSGIYKHLKQTKLWDLSLDDLLLIDFSNIDAQDKVIIYENQNQLVRNFRNTIWREVQNEFVQKITPFIKPNDHIVELGCGYGRHLFTLKKFGFKNQMSGSDISSNAIEVAQQINQKFDMNIDFKIVDYTKKLEIDLKGKTLFTYGSLEQVKDRLEKAINNIIDAKPKQVIHFESIPQLLDNNFYKLMVILNRYRKDYPLNILNILKQNKVLVTHHETLKICTGILNPTMMIRYTI